MRIDCEVHTFRPEARGAAPRIAASLDQLENAACAYAITGLVLVQPAFLKADPTELFARASQAQMPVRLVAPIVPSLAPEVLEGWRRAGVVGLGLALDEPDPVIESLGAALQLDFHLEVCGVQGTSGSRSGSWPAAIAWCFEASELWTAPAIPSELYASSGSWPSQREATFG